MYIRQKLITTCLAASIAIGGSSALANQEMFAELESAAQSSRELELKEPLDVTVKTREELREEQKESIEAESPTEDNDDWNHVLVFLGYIDEGDDIIEIYEAFSGDNILGYYDPATKQLVVVSTSTEGWNVTDKTTFVHETVHALQDQHFDLNGIFFDNVDMTDDFYFARLSLIEGDASTAEIIYLVQNDLIQEAIDEQNGMDTSSLDDVPFFLKESTYFPYITGAEFVTEIWTEGGWEAVNKVWENPPTTTEQIIHPEKYLEGEAAAPVAIADPLPAFGEDWRLLEYNENGELVTRIFLQNGGASEREANTAADGWGGDGHYVITNDDETAMVWTSTWDTQDDADEYFDTLADVETERLDADREDVDDDTVTITGDGWYGQISRDGDSVMYVLAQTEESRDTMIESQVGAEERPASTPVQATPVATPANSIAFWVKEN